MDVSDCSVDLSGKVALVTGATRGIGFATAEILGLAGASLVINSRKHDACDTAQEKLSESGLSVVSCPGHMGDDDARQRLVQRALDTYGRLDIVVSNAGLNPVFARISELPEPTWDKIFDVNLKAAWRLAQYALPEMKKSGGGAMILLSSIGSLVASPNSGAYSIAKAGINSLAKQLAHEWGSAGIRVNAIAPGVTRTDMIREALADERAMEKVKKRTPLHRIAEPEDIAKVILFLASPMSCHLTGQTLVVDGGATLTAG